MIAKFKNNNIPLLIKDIKLYFIRKLPQMMSYLLESGIIKQPNLIVFVRETKNKIN